MKVRASCLHLRSLRKCTWSSVVGLVVADFDLIPSSLFFSVFGLRRADRGILLGRNSILRKLLSLHKLTRIVKEMAGPRASIMSKTAAFFAQRWETHCQELCYTQLVKCLHLEKTAKQLKYKLQEQKATDYSQQIPLSYQTHTVNIPPTQPKAVDSNNDRSDALETRS